MRFSLTLAQKGFILVLIPLAFQLVFVGTLIQMLHQAEREIAEANHARIVVETTEELASRILIFFKLMHEFNPGEVNESIRKFLDGIMRTREDLVKLKTLVAGHHREEVLVARAQTVMDSALDIFENVNREVKRGHTQKAFDLVGRAGGQIVDNLKELINILQEMLEQERAVERAAPARQAAARHNIEETVAVFLGLNCVLALLLAFIFNHNTASRLGILTDNVGRLARNEPLNAPLTGDDEIARIDRAFNEMSESLTAARQKEVAIVENASDAIVSIDIEACFEQVNPAAVKLLGYTAAKLSGASFIDLVFAEDRQKVEQHIDRLHNGEKMPPLEIRLIHRDGTTVDVLWSANWSQSDQALYCVMHNISERKQIDQMKQEFVAMVSHDLRTPLTSVQTCLALVETGNFGEINADGLRFIAMADSNITRLIGLVNGLLDIERMTSGKLDLHFAATTLNEIVQSSIDSVAAYAGQQDIELVADVINADV
ncbi:MAG TPA: PAS domain S-box protein, partial [Chroococcales cyanobacterium]